MINMCLPSRIKVNGTPYVDLPVDQVPYLIDATHYDIAAIFDDPMMIHLVNDKTYMRSIEDMYGLLWNVTVVADCMAVVFKLQDPVPYFTSLMM